jgi:N-acetylglutamate synthase-like GNAT family acetyltransferase
MTAQLKKPMPALTPKLAYLAKSLPGKEEALRGSRNGYDGRRMTPRQQVRRATIEDLPQLKRLWAEERLLVSDLEKRFKEFQVVEGADGQVLGALGLQTAGHEGHLHSEVFLHFEQADALRELLWQRAQTMAVNLGLVRVWTQLETMYWRQNVFEPAAAEVLAKLPVSFGTVPRPWLVIQLKEENVMSAAVLEQELALFKAAERERTEMLIRRARILKAIAAGISLLVFVLALAWAISFFKLHGKIPGR